jgi:hypothetical protein
MSDKLSHYVDVGHGFDWDQQFVKNKGIDLAKDLDFDPDDRLLMLMGKLIV